MTNIALIDDDWLADWMHEYASYWLCLILIDWHIDNDGSKNQFYDWVWLNKPAWLIEQWLSDWLTEWL